MKVRGTLTYYDHDRRLLYLQNGDTGMEIRFSIPRDNDDFWAQPGDVVEIEATVPDSRQTAAVRGKSGRVIGQSKLPASIPLDQLRGFDPALERRLVRVRGWIPAITTRGNRLTFSLVMGPGVTLDVVLNGSDSPKVQDLPGSYGELTGVFALRFDAAGKANGARVFVHSADFVQKLDSVRVMPIGKAGTRDGNKLNEPFRIRGTVVSHTLGQFVILKDSSGSLRMPYSSLTYFNSGSLVEAFAVASRQKPDLVLTNIVIKLVPSGTSTEEPVTAIITRTGPNTNLSELTRVAQIRKLSPQEASRGYPVNVSGIVTYFDNSSYMQFVQDETSGIYLDVSRVENLSGIRAGQKVCVKGFTGPGNFAPVIQSQSIRTISAGSFPAAEAVSFRKLMSGSFDSQWVALKGVVRDQLLTTNSSSLALFAGDGIVKAILPVVPAEMNFSNLVDASVELRGVCRTLFDEHRRLQGVELLVPDWNQLRIHEHPPLDPFSLPVKPINELFQFNAASTEIHRVRLMGVVTYRSSDGSFYLQDASGAVQIQPRQNIPALEVGKLVDVAGFPVIADNLAILQEALGHTESESATLEPNEIKPDNGADDPQPASLIRFKAQILGRFSHGSEELLTARFGDRIIDVSLEKQGATDELSAIEPETVANLTGICLGQPDSEGNLRSFRLLLRSANDIVVLSRPTWWTARRTFRAMGAVAAVLLLALAWAGVLRRQVRQRTEQLHIEIEQHKRTESKLESEIAERKRMESEVQRSHQELIVASRQAGMAEVATSVLHNVGNVLNSVNVSTGVIADKIHNSKSGSLTRVAALIQAHSADLGQFLANDPKGRQLPQYLGRLADHLIKEQATLLTELESLRKNVEHIKGIVGMQQSYARVVGSTEPIKPVELVEDALRMNSGALVRHEVQVVREYQPDLPHITVDKHKLLQILVNLICNAKKACDESRSEERRLTLRINAEEQALKISVIDNGVGIPRGNLTKIFNHGFTTRKDGHGFGLHSGALAAREMGGTLLAHSAGLGKGAEFTLTLPLQSKHPSSTPPNVAAVPLTP